MTIKLCELIRAIHALSKLSAGELDLCTAYKLSKTVKAVQKEIDFFNAQRDKIFTKYGAENESGKIKFAGDGKAAVSDLQALLNLEVNPDCEKLTIVISEGIKLSADDVNALAPFIEFTEN